MNTSDFDEDEPQTDPNERKRQSIERLRKLAATQPTAVRGYIGQLIKNDRAQGTD